jgi:hypothetical protein
MRWGLPFQPVWRRPIFARMDRAAKKINPLLVVVLVMLAIIDLGWYWALELSRWQLSRPAASPVSDAPRPLGPAAVMPPGHD